MRKTFKYRLYPSNAQELKMLEHLNACKNLYNSALEERRNFYRTFKKSLSYNKQSSSLPEIKELLPEYKNIHSQILQDTLKRLDKSFEAFFRRVKSGEKPGFPRFLSHNRYNSFTYPQSGFRLDKNRLSKLGYIKINLHREINGDIKTCTIVKTPTGKWYACFSCVVEKQPRKSMHNIKKVVGIDLGVKNFATTSNKEVVAPEKYLDKHLKKLSIKSHRFSIKNNSRRKRELSLIHEKIKNCRNDWQHKAANKIIRDNDVIIIEKLSIRNMLNDGTKSMRRNISDVSWGEFVNKLLYKAEYAGKVVIQVNPANTSKMCSHCGNIKDGLKLEHRIYECDACNLKIDRDYNASLNIKELGLQELKILQSKSLGMQALEKS